MSEHQNLNEPGSGDCTIISFPAPAFGALKKMVLELLDVGETLSPLSPLEAERFNKYGRVANPMKEQTASQITEILLSMPEKYRSDYLEYLRIRRDIEIVKNNGDLKKQSKISRFLLEHAVALGLTEIETASLKHRGAILPKTMVTLRSFVRCQLADLFSRLK